MRRRRYGREGRVRGVRCVRRVRCQRCVVLLTAVTTGASHLEIWTRLVTVVPSLLLHQHTLSAIHRRPILSPVLHRRRIRHLVVMLHVVTEMQVGGMLLLDLLLLMHGLMVVSLRGIQGGGTQQGGALPEQRCHLHTL